MNGLFYLEYHSTPFFGIPSAFRSLYLEYYAMSKLGIPYISWYELNKIAIINRPLIIIIDIDNEYYNS